MPRQAAGIEAAELQPLIGIFLDQRVEGLFRRGKLLLIEKRPAQPAQGIGQQGTGRPFFHDQAILGLGRLQIVGRRGIFAETEVGPIEDLALGKLGNQLPQGFLGLGGVLLPVIGLPQHQQRFVGLAPAGRGGQRGLQRRHGLGKLLLLGQTAADEEEGLGPGIGILDLAGQRLQQGDNLGILLLQVQRGALANLPAFGVGVLRILLQQLGVELFRLVVLAQLQPALSRHVADVGHQFVGRIGGEEGIGILQRAGEIALGHRPVAGQIEGLGSDRILGELVGNGRIQGNRFGPAAGMAATASARSMARAAAPSRPSAWGRSFSTRATASAGFLSRIRPRAKAWPVFSTTGNRVELGNFVKIPARISPASACLPSWARATACRMVAKSADSKPGRAAAAASQSAAA